MELAPKNNLFHEDTYDTPENRRCWGDRLLLGSSAYFYGSNFNTFRRTGICARKGELSAEMQVWHSTRNFRLIEDCGGYVHLRGLAHLRAMDNKPCVIVANHMSSLETGVIHAFLRTWLDFTFVIKNSLFDVPYFGDIMRAFNAIGVDRVNPREDFKTVMTEGAKRLEAGCSVVIFPQHTRSIEFHPELFNTIGEKLAREAGVPVLPLALKTDFLAPGKFLRDLGPIHRERPVWFEFGEPMMISGNGKAEHQQVIDFISDRLAKWNSLAPADPGE